MAGKDKDEREQLPRFARKHSMNQKVLKRDRDHERKFENVEGRRRAAKVQSEDEQ